MDIKNTFFNTDKSEGISISLGDKQNTLWFQRSEGQYEGEGFQINENKFFEFLDNFFNENM